MQHETELGRYMAFRKSIVFAFVFLVGLLVGAAWKSMQTNKSIPPQPILETAKEKMSIPELVANQFKNGDLNCPNTDSLTYEACLLYQGALGTWRQIGFPETCPNVADENHQYPFPKEGPALLPEDILRAPTVPCFSYLYAIQVANAVPVLVSTSNRTFKMASGKPFIEPGSNPDLCIEARHGICGNHAAVGVSLFERAGFKSRPVEFYYYDKQRLSHIIAEVMIDGGWRPVDTTYGAYWANTTPGKPFFLKTLDDLLNQDLAKRNAKLFHNSALLPYGVYSSISSPDYFNYLNLEASILRGGKGEISLALKGLNGIENFSNLPNYLGDNKADGESAGVSYKFETLPGKYAITINVSGSAVVGKNPVAICIDNNCTAFSEEKKLYRMSAVNPSKLYLKSDNDIAYFVMASVEWKRLD